MTSSNRVPSGVPTGGQFAASTRAEAAGVTLVGDDRLDRIRLAFDSVERMIPRAVADGGGWTEVDRQEDVEAALRVDFPHLPPAAFDERFASIAKTAEMMAVLERAEDTDTEAYAAEAEHVGLCLEDFPVEDPEYWEPGDASGDCAKFHSGVKDEIELELHNAVADLCDADAKAADVPVARTA